MRLLKLKKNAQKTKILKNSNNFAVIAILGDFEEFEGPVPEPPYSYHQKRMKFVYSAFFSCMVNEDLMKIYEVLFTFIATPALKSSSTQTAITFVSKTALTSGVVLARVFNASALIQTGEKKKNKQTFPRNRLTHYHSIMSLQAAKMADQKNKTKLHEIKP